MFKKNFIIDLFLFIIFIIIKYMKNKIILIIVYKFFQYNTQLI